MASKFFESIRRIVGTSEFETYYEKVQLSGVEGTPTVDEARRDYQAALGARISALVD